MRQRWRTPDGTVVEIVIGDRGSIRVHQYRVIDRHGQVVGYYRGLDELARSGVVDMSQLEREAGT